MQNRKDKICSEDGLYTIPIQKYPTRSQCFSNFRLGQQRIPLTGHLLSTNWALRSDTKDDPLKRIYPHHSDHAPVHEKDPWHPAWPSSTLDPLQEGGTLPLHHHPRKKPARGNSPPPEKPSAGWLQLVRNQPSLNTVRHLLVTVTNPSGAMLHFFPFSTPANLPHNHPKQNIQLSGGGH